MYTIHDKNSDFLDDNGEGKNKFHKFIYLVNKLHGECSERENEFAPKMCISATVIIVVNFSDGLQTRKLSPPYFLQQCTTDLPIKPINRPINWYRPINRIGNLEKYLYRIGIGSADYKGLYRLIGFTYYSYFCRHEKSLNWVKLVQSLE